LYKKNVTCGQVGKDLSAINVNLIKNQRIANMFRMFDINEQSKRADTLAMHLIAKIEEEYIQAATAVKWINWIGQRGIARANALKHCLLDQKLRGITDAALASDMIDKLRLFREGSYFEESKNLRALVANEMCRYMGVDMNALRIAVSNETTNRITSRGLTQDPRHIEAEVAAIMLKAKINQQPASRPGVSIN
jgi:hypothetical protein